MKSVAGLSGRRILVVEDEALIAFEMADLLTDEGAVVVGPAIRLSDAETAARGEALDLAILDADIGGNSSGEVARILSSRGIPFVVTSGKRMEELTETYPDLGPVCPKPYEPGDLLDIVVSAMPPATVAAD